MRWTRGHSTIILLRHLQLDYWHTIAAASGSTLRISTTLWLDQDCSILRAPHTHRLWKVQLCIGHRQHQQRTSLHMTFYAPRQNYFPSPKEPKNLSPPNFKQSLLPLAMNAIRNHSDFYWFKGLAGVKRSQNYDLSSVLIGFQFEMMSSGWWNFLTTSIHNQLVPFQQAPQNRHLLRILPLPIQICSNFALHFVPTPPTFPTDQTPFSSLPIAPI